jgi:hypothetical protein
LGQFLVVVLTINDAQDSPACDSDCGAIISSLVLALNRGTLHHLQQGLALRALLNTGKLIGYFSCGNNRQRDRGGGGASSLGFGVILSTRWRLVSLEASSNGSSGARRNLMSGRNSSTMAGALQR